jgi:flagella basal body P-ring formation protein FlgA
MFRNKLICVSILTLGLCLCLCDTEVSAKPSLRIYLPAEKTLTSDVITLGQIAMVLGDPSLKESAGKITLGRFSAPGQEIVIDRETILSRLVSEGVKASVNFNGSGRIRLFQDGSCISSDEFIAAAESCLKKALAGEGVHSFKLIRSPDNFPLTCKRQDVTLSSGLSKYQSGATKRVTVSVMMNDVQLYHQDVLFTLQYQAHRLVATKDIPPKESITPENVQLETYLSSQPTKENPQFYGMITRRTVPAGTVITSNFLESRKPTLLVKRRQKVLLKLESGGLFVSAMGEAMSDGGPGDIIEVKRGTGREQRTIIGRIMSDGTVKPVL